MNEKWVWPLDQFTWEVHVYMYISRKEIRECSSADNMKSG